MRKSCEQANALADKLFALIDKEAPQDGDSIDGEILMHALSQIVVTYAQDAATLHFFAQAVNIGYAKLNAPDEAKAAVVHNEKGAVH